MSFNYYVGNFTLNTSTGNQSITGVGFTPKAVILFHGNTTAFGSAVATANAAQGFAIDSGGTGTQVCYCTSDPSGSNPPNPWMRYDDTKCFTNITTGGTVTEAASFVSNDGDGFTINVTTASAAIVVNFICLGGSINVALLALTTPAATGSQSYTLPFKPNTLFAMGFDKTAAAPAASATATVGAGVCDVALGQAAISNFSEVVGGTTSNTSRWTRTDSVINLVGSSEAQNFRMNVTSYDAAGFTGNWAATAGSGRLIYVLAISGVNSFMKSFNQPTSTGSVAYTGVGFLPNGLIMASTGVGNTTPAGNEKWYWGSSSGTSNVGGIGVAGNDNAASSLTAKQVSNTSFYCSVSAGASPTLNGATGLTSFDSDGFTLPWTTVDGATRVVWTMSLANSATNPLISLALTGVGL